MAADDPVKNLIVKYVNHSCSEAELKAFLEMLENGSFPVETFDDVMEEYWNSEPEEKLTVKQRLEYRNEAMRLIGGRRSVNRRRIPSRKTWLAAAAVAVVVAGGLCFSAVLGERQEKVRLSQLEQISTSRGQIRTVELPDGTSVTLNVSSSLSYNGRYGEEIREVWLSGEAYFDVESNDKCPFAVHSEDLDIHVTGTSFNVQAYPEDTRKTVTVTSGNVGISYADDIRMNLRKNEQIVIDAENSSVLRSPADVDAAVLWMRGCLVFRQNTIEEVANMLERYYSCDIELKGTASQVRLSGTHDNKSIESVLQSVCFSAGLQYEKKGNSYVIF